MARLATKVGSAEARACTSTPLLIEFPRPTSSAAVTAPAGTTASPVTCYH